MITLYKGYHSQELYLKIIESWNNGDPLILCPEQIKDLSFADTLKDQEIRFLGTWDDKQKQDVLNKAKFARFQFPQDAILAVFTSGTVSGSPRLIFYSKENILSSLNSINKLFDLNRLQKIFCYPQPGHVFGLVLGYVQAIENNLQLIISEGAYSHHAHEKWINHVDEGTLTLGTPAHFMDLIQWCNKNNLQPPKTYSAIIGGASATKKLWEDLKEKLNVDSPSVGYGASEASPGIMHLPPGVVPSQDGEIGYLLDGVVLNQINEKGFTFSGPMVCKAIWDENGIKLPTQVFLNDLLIKNKETDRYVFNGRTDFLVNRGGLKYSLEIIEGKVSSELSCKCVAVSIFDERLGEDVGIVIQPNPEIINDVLIAKTQDLLRKEFSLNLLKENITIQKIPLSINGKFDRVESMKLVLQNKRITFPINVQHLKNFMPHRGNAIWVHRITGCNNQEMTAEVDINKNGHFITDNKLRPSACIEMVAQAYGYGVVAKDILGIEVTGRKNKTLIAEVRDARFFFEDWNNSISDHIQNNKSILSIQTECTHRISQLRVIKGTVKHGDHLLAQVSLKALVSE